MPGSHAYPESVTAADGALINGGFGDGAIYRTARGRSRRGFGLSRERRE